MQVKINVNGSWWLIPTPEFTEKELAPYLSHKWVAPFGVNETVHFFNPTSKKKALEMLDAIIASLPNKASTPTAGTRRQKSKSKSSASSVKSAGSPSGG